MTFSFVLQCTDANDLSVTGDWLKSVGLPPSYLDPSRFKVPVFIDFISPPYVLSQFSLLDSDMQVTCLSSQGVTFYLCDAVFHDFTKADEDQQFFSSRPDGFLFVPMSNISSINFFGLVSRRR